MPRNRNCPPPAPQSYATVERNFLTALCLMVDGAVSKLHFSKGRPDAKRMWSLI